jgi:hypothetical protein
MDGRGSFPVRANISLISVSRKSLSGIFFPPHEDKNDATVDNGQVQQVKKSFFAHFHVLRLAV